MTRFVAFGIISALIGISTAAPASVYLADSFSYADGTALASQWTGSGTLTAGLSFAELSTSGGALQLTNATVSRPAAAVPLYTPMWTSFLVRQDTAIADSTWGDTNKVGAFFTNADGTNARYQYLPLNARVWGNVNATCASAGTFADASPGLRITAGQTYLVLGYIDHVGMGNWTSLTVSMWMYNESAFASFLAAGGTAANLDSTALAKATSTASTWAFTGINAGDLLNLRSTVGKATLDEYRSGTTLADVVVVPEPGMIVTATLLAGGMALTRRRRA